MALVATVAGIEEDQHVRLNQFGLQSNADGSVGFGGIVFDDSAGALTINGWHEVIVREPDCVEAPVLFRGWIGDRVYSRNGSEARYKITSARFIDCNLVDQNGALAIRLFVNATAKRPAETDIRRINWLLGGADPGGLDNLVADLGLVDRSSPRPFEDADYRGAYAMDVLNDLAGPLGRIFFVYLQQPNGELGLFYDFPTSTVNTSNIIISNVLSDILADTTGNTVGPYMDATLHRDPSEVVSLVRFQYRNGVLLEGDTTTQTTFFAAAATGGLELLNRGINTSNDRVGLEDTARIMADGILSKNSVEHDEITVTIQLPSTKAGWVDIGQRVAVRFQHLPGYETSTYMRVQSRNIQHSQGTNLLYDVTLVLSNTGLHSNGGGGSTGPGDFPQPPVGPPEIVQQKFQLVPAGGAHTNTVTLDAPPSAGNWLVMGVASRGTAITLPAGWTEHPHGNITPGADVGRMAYREVGAGESADIAVTTTAATYAMVWEVSGIDGTLDTSSFADVDTTTQPASINAGTLTPTSDSVAIMFMFLVMHCSDWGGNGATSMTTPSGWTLDGEYEVTNNGDLHPNVQADSRIETSTSGSYATSSTIAGAGFNFGGWGGLALAFLGSAGVHPTSPGQDVPWEVVTMTTLNGVSTGTTQFPFADRSLQVKVDGVLISTASYVEDDGACGDFHLTWQIDADETVTVKYIGR